jgi:hypothetical protein
MSDVHGNRIDRSRGAVAARWWGLGILSLARLTARGLLTSCERAQGVEGRPGRAIRLAFTPAFQVGALGAEAPVNLAWFSR